ncbi:hypothetical protein [Desulfovibrio inopinatus]|uniref:hypothetical protein n=1 Tax=Desulfovibrio inopinatus TaxID=102109 RepID=UPI000422F255|nr:hypothetical protein [Desulfovibrio inopinatus]
MSMDPELSRKLDALVKGLMIGGSVGVIGGLFFLDMRRAFVLGLIAGFFAALTRLRMDR